MEIQARYTLEDIRTLLLQLGSLVDVARIVDTTETTVVMLNDDGSPNQDPCSCFSALGREHRCDNCTSMQALIDGERKSKYHITEENAYYMVCWPILLEEEDGQERQVVLEIIMKTREPITEQEGGALQLKKQLKEARLRLHRDDLTQVYNRRYLNEFAFLYRKQDYVPQRISLILLDLRKFKEVNDTLGHTAGDRILQQVGQALQSHVRDRDSVIRYGGDEFVVILTDCAPEVLPRKSEELRQAIAPFSEANFGWAHTDQFQIDPDFLERMIHEADAMMYEEKRKQGGSSR